MGVFRLNSLVQHYEWGSLSDIADLLGRTSSGRPEAELWMGAHPRCPSMLTVPSGAAKNLAELIQVDPERCLGVTVASRFGRLPYLFKVLAAAQPLSLQAHPTILQAEEGFLREEAAGVPIAAAYRNYKDKSHKPELIYALSEFWALSGFRLFEEAIFILRTYLPVMSGTFSESFEEFRNSPDGSGLEGFFRAIFSLPQSERDKLIDQLSQRTLDPTLSGEARRIAPWVQKLAALYPGDPGVIASLLLNVVRLSPGEAMYLPAGNLHAYLSGLGLEIMASSDNVMRGGLTGKHVDLNELCSILSFLPFVPLTQSGSWTHFSGGSCTRFVTEAEEFELSILQMSDGTFETMGPEIWLVLDGAISISGAESPFRRGDQVFISAENNVEARGTARIARASLGRL